MVAVPGGVEGEKAELISPELTVETKVDLCISFKFIMIGTGNGELRVNMRFTNGTTIMMWQAFDDQANQVNYLCKYKPTWWFYFYPLLCEEFFSCIIQWHVLFITWLEGLP